MNMWKSNGVISSLTEQHITQPLYLLSRLLNRTATFVAKRLLAAPEESFQFFSTGDLQLWIAGGIEFHVFSLSRRVALIQYVPIKRGISNNIVTTRDLKVGVII